jgi:glyoxylase-like metal-dependent hydrolase (beta-lactamase superfamily II)
MDEALGVARIGGGADGKHTPHAPVARPALPLPPRAELLPGVWRLPLPLRDSPLGHVNTYLVRADNGYLLVDCGWDTADTLHALEGHLRALDIRMPDIRHLVITHIHPDDARQHEPDGPRPDRLPRSHS